MKSTLKITCCALLALGFSKTYAQKKINEGIVTYTVNFELPPDKQQYASMLPKEITTYFRGDSTSTSLQQGPATIKTVQDYKTNFQEMLIDVPVASKKISVLLSPDEIDQMDATSPKLTSTPGTETQTIDGYKCTKVVATDAKTGAKYDIWVTKDIDLVPNSLTKMVSTFGGVPIKFVTFNQGIKVNAELKEIKEIAVPKGYFTATKDYQSMSMDELKSMTGQK